MHVAASRPLAVLPSGIAPELLERRKTCYRAGRRVEKRPIVEKMIAGRMTKFVRENSLSGRLLSRTSRPRWKKFLHRKGLK
ncbi:MAG: hypothetical protein CM1200mP41_33660 [Gammaproteobacteria bacterium]|nr:MAG: hypothetical protein CM1200mP41_33660 [Gammaproteobacteria bacterium]